MRIYYTIVCLKMATSPMDTTDVEIARIKKDVEKTVRAMTGQTVNQNILAKAIAAKSEELKKTDNEFKNLVELYSSILRTKEFAAASSTNIIIADEKQVSQLAERLVQKHSHYEILRIELRALKNAVEIPVMAPVPAPAQAPAPVPAQAPVPMLVTEAAPVSGQKRLPTPTVIVQAPSAKRATKHTLPRETVERACQSLMTIFTEVLKNPIADMTAFNQTLRAIVEQVKRTNDEGIKTFFNHICSGVFYGFEESYEKQLRSFSETLRAGINRKISNEKLRQEIRDETFNNPLGGLVA